MLQTLRGRIATTYAVLLIVITALLGAYVAWLARTNYVETLRSRMGAEARLIANAASAVPEGQYAAWVHELKTVSGLRVTFIGLDGVVLGDSDVDPAAMDDHRDRPEVVEALGSGLGESTRYSETVGQNMLYVAAPIRQNNRLVGIARVSRPLTEVEATVRSTVAAIALAGTVAAVITVVMAMVLARRVTRSLQEVTVAATKLAAGDLSHRVHATKPAEIVELTSALNRMADQVQSTIGAISAERDKLSAVLATLHDGVLFTDEDGHVASANPATQRLLRLGGRRILGRPLIEVVRDHELVAVMDHALATGRTQTRLVERGPGGRTLRVVASPLREGRRAALLLLQDLTELRRLETARRDFLANLSHELRTPLASLQVLVETLHEGALDDTEAARHFLDRMQVELDGLTQLVREVLELSRIESGQIHLVREAADIAELVRGPAERLRPQAERAGVELALDLPQGELPAVLADRDRIGQVVINLVHNAIKFTPHGGRIVVSAGMRDGDVMVSVADTGIGIAADALTRIFERFYKTERSRTSSGTGLGLAIVKHLVQAHGGRTWAESEEGRGATFYFTLPVAPVEAVGAEGATVG